MCVCAVLVDKKIDKENVTLRVCVFVVLSGECNFMLLLWLACTPRLEKKNKINRNYFAHLKTPCITEVFGAAARVVDCIKMRKPRFKVVRTSAITYIRVDHCWTRDIFTHIVPCVPIRIPLFLHMYIVFASSRLLFNYKYDNLIYKN